MHDPFSSYSEGIRAIKGAIDLSERPERARVIGISSTVQGEGKSTVAASLGLLCAQVGAKAIVVDCDLRHATLTKQLSPSSTVGLLQVVTGLATLDDAIWTNPASGMSFLPAVLSGPMANSNEVLASEAIHDLFEKLRERFDYVFVDLPPLTPVIDVRATGHFVQQYVLVMEWGKTRVDAIEEALIAARALKEQLLGVVLNKADTTQLHQYQTPFTAARRLSEKVASHWVVRDTAS